MKRLIILAAVVVLPMLGSAEAPRTYCRFVPERSDDFAWENDKIAFRAYGPALADSTEDSGFDAWLKRVDYSIIDKWYAGHIKGVTYHKDHGEGYDPYKVGESRGCGGLALWIDEEMVLSNVFKEWEIIQCEPEKSVFVLRYEWQLGEDTYTEEKQISIALGDRVFKSVSTFAKNGAPAKELPIAIGLVRHHQGDAVENDLSAGWMSIWETIDGDDLGVGVVINPDRINDYKLLDDHAVIIAKTDAQGQLEYYAGYGWERAGEITTQKAWNKYLMEFAQRLVQDGQP